MKTSWRTLAAVVVMVAGWLGPAACRAHGQAFGFGYARPGFAFGVGTGPYGGAVFGGYPVVAPAPVVVAPPPVVVPAPPLVVARPLVVPRPYYGGYYYGGYRPYSYAYRYYRR
jgi:hypothetical protein